MEIFGGFIVMMSIIGLFLAVVWLVMPFVVFAIKEKQDRSLKMLEGVAERLTAMEAHLKTTVSERTETEPSPQGQTANTMAAGRVDSSPAPMDYRAENI